MQKRALGDTGLEVSSLGLGGFHMLEIGAAEAAAFLTIKIERGKPAPRFWSRRLPAPTAARVSCAALTTYRPQTSCVTRTTS